MRYLIYALVGTALLLTVYLPKEKYLSEEKVSTETPRSLLITAEPNARAPASTHPHAPIESQKSFEKHFSRREQELAELFSQRFEGENLKCYVLNYRKTSGTSNEASEKCLQALQEDAASAMGEIYRVIEKMPNDSYAEEKLLLIEAAGKLPGKEEESASLALDLASGKLHSIPSSGSSFETFSLPMGAFEVFVNEASDPSFLLNGTARVIGAQENSASRRMLLKLFIALKPDLVSELNRELAQQGVVIKPKEL